MRPVFSPPRPEPEARARYLAGLFLQGAKLDEATLEVRTIGQLYVPSGRIVACDPLVFPDTKPFTTTVPTGRHAVEISIARRGNGDERIAAARLRWNGDVPDHWLMALVEGQNPATLGPDEVFGYAVDAGLGCFMDRDSAVIFNDRLNADHQNDPASNYYDDVLAAEMEPNYKHTRDWTDHHPRAGDPHNVVIFSSGFGDGFYVSYFGMAGDQPVCLVTDFAVGPG